MRNRQTPTPTRPPRPGARLLTVSASTLGVYLASTSASLAILAADGWTPSLAWQVTLFAALAAGVVAVCTLVRYFDVTGHPPFRTGVVVADLAGPPADGPAPATSAATPDAVKVG